VLGYITLRDEGNVRSIQMFQRPSMKVVEALNGCHEVALDNMTADIVKSPREVVWPRSLPSQHFSDFVLGFILCERQVQRWIMDLAEMKSSPI
jgi:hypothetical protein